jgi:hypothetical protein
MANRLPGLVQVAADMPVVEPGSSVNTRMASDGSAEALSQWSGVLGNIGEQVGRLADHAAQAEGAAHGKQDGLDPEFRPTRSLTIRGEAYDQAGLEVYQSKLSADLQGDLDQTYAAHSDNPQVLQAMLAKKGKAWLDKSLPEVRPAVQLQLQRANITYMREAARGQQERVFAEQQGAMQSSLTQTLATMHQQAFALGLDGTADQVMAGHLGDLTAMLKRTDPAGRPLVRPEQAAKIVEGATQEVANARLLGAYARLNGLEAKAQFIEQFDADWQAGKGLAKIYDLNGYQQMSSALGAELRRDQTMAGVGQRQLAGEIKDIQFIAEKGFAPPPDQMAGLKARVAGTNDPELGLQLAEAEDLMKWQSSARRSTPLELQGWIDKSQAELDKGGADTRSVQRLELARKLHGEMQRGLDANQLGWAKRVGLLEVPPLDLSDPVKMVASLKQRGAIAETVAHGYGRNTVYLEPDEKNMLAAYASKGGQQLLGLSAAANAAYGDKAGDFLAEISKLAPEAAYVGGMQLGGADPQAIKDASIGLGLRQNPNFVPLIKTTNTRPLLKTHDPRDRLTNIPEALRAMPTALDAAMKVANSIYEVRARRAGDVDAKAIDGGMYRGILNEVLGAKDVGGVTYGGIATRSTGFFGFSGAVVAPVNVKAAGFDDLINSITDEDLAGGQPLDHNRQPLGAKTIRGASLVTIGPGRYHVAIGDPDSQDPQYAAGDGPGGLFVLDLGKLEPSLRKRRPDLYGG